MIKRFVYFESAEGGMDQHIVRVPEDLEFLRDWMEHPHSDLHLLEWMETSEVGEYTDHRLGVLVRLKDQ